MNWETQQATNVTWNNSKSSKISTPKTTATPCFSTSTFLLATTAQALSTLLLPGVILSPRIGFQLIRQFSKRWAPSTTTASALGGWPASCLLMEMVSSTRVATCNRPLGSSKTWRRMCHNWSLLRPALTSPVKLWRCSVTWCWPKPSTCSTKWPRRRNSHLRFYPRLRFKFHNTSKRHMKWVRQTEPSRNSITADSQECLTITTDTLREVLGWFLVFTDSLKPRKTEEIWALQLVLLSTLINFLQICKVSCKLFQMTIMLTSTPSWSNLETLEKWPQIKLKTCSSRRSQPLQTSRCQIAKTSWSLIIHASKPSKKFQLPTRSWDTSFQLLCERCKVNFKPNFRIKLIKNTKGSKKPILTREVS